MATFAGVVWEGSSAAYRLGADVRAFHGLREEVLASLEQRGHVPVRYVVRVTFTIAAG
jgi:hypothetical protein